MAGRPSHKVEVSFTNPLRSIIHFRRFCENNEEGSYQIRTFAESLFLTRTSSSKSTQTDNDASMLRMFVKYLKILQAMKSPVSNLWSTIHKDFQVKLLFLFYGDFDNAQQADIISL